MGKKTRNPKTKTPKKKTPFIWHTLFALVCALIVGIFAQTAEPGFLESITSRSEDSYYNLLVQGFRSGQLNVKREASPGLAKLSNPYDPAVNMPYVWDIQHLSYEMSYYQGKLYLYFGVTPALVVFLPYAVLTGHYLLHKNAVVILFSLGFVLASVLLYRVWRKYFVEASFWTVVSGMLAMGLATGILETLSSCDVYEVAKSCAFAFAMLSLLALWFALNDLKNQIKWMVLASLAYGLAIGSRPSLLFGGIILLAPLVQNWCQVSEKTSIRRLVLLLAATAPVTLIVLGLLLYNQRRFDSPLEFGWHYQLTNTDNHIARQFSLHYLWSNFQFYFLEPTRWSSHFPFLQGGYLSSAPSGYYGFASPASGILLNYPVVWLGLAAPLAWRNRPVAEVFILRRFVTAIFVLFVICAATLCLFFASGSSYELDFLPALMLLAVIGILGLEHFLADSPSHRYVARTIWAFLLAYSIVFNVLASVKAHAEAACLIGNSFLSLGHVDDALVQYQKALQLWPDSAEAHSDLGKALFEKGQPDKAITEFNRALEINTNFPVAYNNLGYCYLKTGKLDDAIVQFQKALAAKPDLADAQFNLAYCLLKLGRVDDAIVQYQKGIKLKPDFVEAYCNLGYAFSQKGMASQAVASYEKAIALDPRLTSVQIRLAWLLATCPDPSVRDGIRAVTLAEQAVQATGGADPNMLRVLAAAYAEAGRFPEAVLTAKRAYTMAASQSNSVLADELQLEINLYANNSPCRSTSY